MLIVLAVLWATMALPTLCLPVQRSWRTDEVVLLAGFALLPVASIGLWRWRRWGLVVFLVATLLVFCGAIADGVQAAVLAAILHLICLGLTLLRYYSARREEPAT